MKKILLATALATLLVADTFAPAPMQYGCRSIGDYQKADTAAGYGAQRVFLDAGCLYLRGIDLIVVASQDGYVQVCNVHAQKECYWTPDTRP